MTLSVTSASDPPTSPSSATTAQLTHASHHVTTWLTHTTPASCLPCASHAHHVPHTPPASRLPCASHTACLTPTVCLTCTPCASHTACLTPTVCLTCTPCASHTACLTPATCFSHHTRLMCLSHHTRLTRAYHCNHIPQFGQQGGLKSEGQGSFISGSGMGGSRMGASPGLTRAAPQETSYTSPRVWHAPFPQGVHLPWHSPVLAVNRDWLSQVRHWSQFCLTREAPGEPQPRDTHWRCPRGRRSGTCTMMATVWARPMRAGWKAEHGSSGTGDVLWGPCRVPPADHRMPGASCGRPRLAPLILPSSRLPELRDTSSQESAPGPAPSGEEKA
ncbi:uncharacterized protein LOC125090628 [Lutra lutra]|uniref:uncharacterized protein LOC125090628 n=1 Tax=Lutra lutra TaxID=9657 RepID=UPI001FD213F2|nr:uncharacterized protein LOC125090628 [Lutra lutra]